LLVSEFVVLFVYVLLEYTELRLLIMLSIN
jgi:hypothetical protein